ncbi:conserved membrane hypothetical protein [Candidatus Magnetomoraceae bacterium gMMP-13]
MLNKKILFWLTISFVLLNSVFVLADFPPAELLKEMENRLLKNPDCLPHCADISKMELMVYPDRLRIVLEIHAAVKTAIPLPGVQTRLCFHEVVLDDKPAKGLFHDSSGVLWILINSGIHKVILSGKTPENNSFNISLPLKPRYVTVKSEGWNVQGVLPDGQVQAGIQLTRKKQISMSKSVDRGIITPFFHVKRLLRLGLKWQVWTTLIRITPIGRPVTVSVPMLAGESITTDGISVENKKAVITMGPKQKSIKWNSTLELTESIELQATELKNMTETWILDASSMWHCNLTGIPVIHHQDERGQRRPTWKPWPGESITIHISRPLPVQGQSLTIDRVNLEYHPGQSIQRGILNMEIRTSKGGQYAIGMPENAKLQNISINGMSQPIRLKDQKIMIPLEPGSQDINLNWHQSEGSYFLTQSPNIDLNHEAVNADVTFNIQHNRWVLFAGGPKLGPAVLFWSYFLVIILIAFGLGRISWTPLKTGHWLLLCLGLTQIHPLGAAIIVGWLLALGLRKKEKLPDHWFPFNIMQLALLFLTIAALIGLYLSVQKGLLGIPDMQISGNGSSNFHLHWTQDRIKNLMPQPWILSVPLFVYRFLMLLWALWLALALLKWLKWGFSCFSKHGIWKKASLRRKIVTKNA